MKQIENNIQALQDFADEQAGLALQMYKIMKSTYYACDEADTHLKMHHNCEEGKALVKRIKSNITEYLQLLNQTADGCMVIQNLK